MITIQDQDVSSSNYKEYILKYANITIDTCRKLREKSQNIQRAKDACRDGTVSHIQAANFVQQELALKCGLSRENPKPYYKCDHQ
jgi:hypothetical protein